MPPKGGRSGPGRAPREAAESTSQVATMAPGPESIASGSGHGSSAPEGSTRSAKFRPRGNRRSAAERDRIAQQQLDIQSRRAAEDARARGRSRFRRGFRAPRGAFRQRDIRPSDMGGVDSTAGPAAGRHVGSSSRGFGGTSRGGGGGVRRRAGPSEQRQGYGFAYNTHDDNRINADELRGRGEEDGEDDDSRQKLVMPMGLNREEIQQGAVAVASAADEEEKEHIKGKDEDGESSNEDLWVGEEDGRDRYSAELEQDDAVWSHAVPKTRSRAKIKREDGGVDEVGIDELAARKQSKAPESPELSKKSIDVAPGKRPKKQPVRSGGLEEEIKSGDLEQLVELLAIRPDGQEAETGDGESAPQNMLEGNMFLFQFPPVLAPLETLQTSAGQDEVKDEPSDDVVMLDQPRRGPAVNVDLTGDEQDGAAGLADDGKDADKRKDMYDKGGFIGKLVVRKSGKVELSWGGLALDLVSGTPTQFLTTAVLLEDYDEKAKPGETAGIAYGMGKIEGKFVLAPNWDEEDDWAIDATELQ